ncbi:MAG: hypothetical protein GXO88_05130 [Chlorobi bacterium]|nr:hypothetical protein [Chlorobiota bacterium]
MKPNIIIVIIVLLGSALLGQGENSFTNDRHRFGNHEKLDFEVYYNYGLIYTKVGNLILKADSIYQEQCNNKRFGQGLSVGQYRQQDSVKDKR